MEEISSTAVLDREVLEDARKKADRILKDADRETDALIAEGRSRIAETEAALKKRYENRLAEFERNLANSIPLEKNRKKMKYVDSLLTKALDSYLSSLDAGTVEGILGRLLKRASGAFAGKTVSAEYCGMDRPAAERLILSAIGNGTIESVEPSAEGDYVGCVIRTRVEENAGKSEETRFSATIAEVRSFLLERKRGDLANALFPGGTV